MTEPSIDVSIMAHPSRAASAEALHAQLADEFPTKIVYDPDPDGPRSTIRTARLAWRPHDPAATHHLLIQDDAVLRPDLADCLRQIIQVQPDRWISLACEWGCKTAWVCRDAAMAYRPYGPVVDSYLPLWGLLMPREDADRLADSLANVGLGTPDDHALADFAVQHEISPPLITVPNLLVHGNLPSLIGNDAAFGHRGTALAVTEPIPAGWWHRPPLDPEQGAPVMAYWIATKPFTLHGPGHYGYDVHSLYFTSDQREATEQAWRDFGIELDGELARAFTLVCLTYTEAIRFAAKQQLPSPDPTFASALQRATSTNLVNGMFRSLLDDQTRDQAPHMIDFLNAVR